MIEAQNHRTLVMWALDCAQGALSSFEGQYPAEVRPQRALELCEAWARGIIKMPEAKRAILGAHAVAKEIDDRECIALCHAIGHAGATVHVATHALGFVFYELTALVLNVGLERYESAVSMRMAYYRERLSYWQMNVDALNVDWAKFLLDDA